ncbi:MAG: cytochrome c [Mariprofundaceae bacterium]
MKNILFALLAVLFLPVSVSAMDIPDANSVGGRLFAQQCSACHALPHPKRLDWARWQPMLRVMKKRMNERNMLINDAEWRRIAIYLKAHAR